MWAKNFLYPHMNNEIDNIYIKPIHIHYELNLYAIYICCSTSYFLHCRSFLSICP